MREIVNEFFWLFFFTFILYLHFWALLVKSQGVSLKFPTIHFPPNEKATTVDSPYFRLQFASFPQKNRILSAYLDSLESPLTVYLRLAEVVGLFLYLSAIEMASAAGAATCEVLTAYRSLLRAAKKAFTGDKQMVQGASAEIRKKFEENRGVKSEDEIKKLLGMAEEGSQFLATMVVQAELNESGNYGTIPQFFFVISTITFTCRMLLKLIPLEVSLFDTIYQGLSNEHQFINLIHMVIHQGFKHLSTGLTFINYSHLVVSLQINSPGFVYHLGFNF